MQLLQAEPPGPQTSTVHIDIQKPYNLYIYAF